MPMKNDIRQKSTHSTTTIQLQALLEEANSVVKEIDKIANDFATQFNEINSNIDESITNIERICFEIDQIDKETGDEIDKLVLQQAEIVAEE